MLLALIKELDNGPEELHDQLPLLIELIRPLNAPDGSDYALAELDKAFEWKGKEITHIIVGARFGGSRVGRGMEELPINIALVIDNSLLNDSDLDFAKGEYVAIGFATDVTPTKA